ncbi:U3 snoRNP protein [Tulasnella sp. 424]|nr:U3 snoRNP protein [Tulasnella sp. 424]
MSDSEDSYDSNQGVQQYRAPRTKWLRKSYHQQLKNVHVPSALATTALDFDVEETDSHFHESIQRWREISVQPSFLSFASRVQSMSRSFPLLLHNWKTIVELWIQVVKVCEEEAITPLLDMLQNLAHDLRTTLLPSYPAILTAVFDILPSTNIQPATTDPSSSSSNPPTSSRPLPTPNTIKTLLTTLSSLFRYILLPNAKQLLRPSWLLLRQTMLSVVRRKGAGLSGEEIERTLAEVWGGSVLRKLKGKEVQQEGVNLLVDASVEQAEGVTWIWVSAIQAPNGTIHPSSKTLLAHLVERYLAEGDEEVITALVVLWRRILTSVINWTSSAKPFESISELMVEVYKREVGKDEEIDSNERIARMWKILAFTCSAKKGTKMQMKQISSLLSLTCSLSTLSSSPSSFAQPQLTCLTHFVSAALVSGDMTTWNGPARQLTQTLFSSFPLLALRLSAILSDLGWAGWNLVIGPQVGKVIVPLLTTMPEGREEAGSSEALGLVAHLVKKGLLADVSEGARGEVAEWTRERLDVEGGKWSLENEANVHDLSLICPLGTWLPVDSLVPSAVNIIRHVFDTIPTKEAAKADFDSRPTNAALILSICFTTLGQDHKGKKKGASKAVVDNETQNQWMKPVMESWSWSSDVLDGYCVFVESCPPSGLSMPYTDAFEHLRPSLLSPYQPLRLATFRFLLLPCITRTPSQDRLLRKLQSIERISVDFEGFKERVIKISALLTETPQHDRDFDLASIWLLSQLKVNLRPVWAPSVTALASLMKEDPVKGWDVVFRELIKASPKENNETGEKEVDKDGLGIVEPSWKDEALKHYVDPDPVDVEKSWSDGDRRAVTRAVMNLGELAEERMKLDIAKAQVPARKLDVLNYENQLLAILAEAPHVAERFHRPLVSFFLSQRMPRYRLSHYLTLFAKFRNPRQIHESARLRSLYTSLLSEPDRAVQRQALSCILAYNSPSLKPYEERMTNLVENRGWRVALGQWNFDEVEEHHRQEAVDVVIRLLYGLLLNRKGSDKSASSKTPILTTIAKVKDEEIAALVDLMLGPFGGMEQAMEYPKALESDASKKEYVLRGLGDEVTKGQMSGFLLLLQDVMRVLGPKLSRYWSALFVTTLEITAAVQAEMENAMDVDRDADVEARDEDDGEEGSEEQVEKEVLEETTDDPQTAAESGPSRHSAKLAKNARKLAFKRLESFFDSPIPFDYTPYMRAAITSFISPRLKGFTKENMAVAGTFLPLIVTWSKHSAYLPYLEEYDSSLLPSLFKCLGLDYVGTSVANQILDIIDNITRFAKEDNDPVALRIIDAHVDCVLGNLYSLMQRKKIVKSDAAVQRQINVLLFLAPYIKDEVQAEQLLALLLPLLQRNARTVPEKVKASLLKIIAKLVLHVPAMRNVDSETYGSSYSFLSRLLGSLTTRDTREALVEVFGQLATVDEALQAIHPTLKGINTFNKVDKPITDAQLEALALLNESLYRGLSARQWLPLVHNIFNIIRETEDFPLRNTASLSLRRFIDTTAEAENPEMVALFGTLVYRGLTRGLETGSQDARGEVAGILQYATEKSVQFQAILELQPLLMEGRKEDDVLLNLYHVQAGQRSRALRNLGEICETGVISSKTLADVFVPILNGFIIRAANQAQADQAIATLGKVANRLEWSAYFAAWRRYMTLSKLKSNTNKAYARTVVSILDNFHFSLEEVSEAEVTEVATAPEVVEEAEGVDERPEGETEIVEVEEPVRASAGVERFQIYRTVTKQILPELLRFMEARDEVTDKLRIPLAVGIPRVALHLPSSERGAQISRLLTILAHTFRSKSTDVRYLCRDTLFKVVTTLGSDYLPTLVKELKLALTRGPHLHILASVVHGILKHITAPEHAERMGNLDECVDDIAGIATEVVFGESAANVQADGFRSAVKEVAGSAARGQEIFTILAKYVSPGRINRVLEPVRGIMHETVQLRTMNLVDEVLRRIAAGLNANARLAPQDILVICHSLITQNAKFLQQVPRLKKKDGKIHRDVAVDLKVRRVVERVSDHYASNSFRFVTFGLDLFLTTFKNGRLDLKDPEIVSRLEPFVSAIGNTLYSNESKVVVLGLRATAVIVRCPLKAVNPATPAFIKQIMSIVQYSGNTESEAAQTALKTMATVLDSCPDAEVEESDLTLLLSLIQPDLEETGRQDAPFSLLRSILTRKLLVPEVYDAMDRVAEIMVTNQSSKTQGFCRDLYYIFVTDYPQGKARMKTSMEFLARNLAYAHESGRKSVMEMMNRVFESFKQDLLSQYANLHFLALVMVLANDESSKCREMGANLLSTLFERMDAEQRTATMTLAQSWSKEGAKPQLRRVAIQLFGLFLPILGQDGKPYIKALLRDLTAILQSVVSASQGRQSDEDVEMDESTDRAKDKLDEEWQVAHQGLTTLAKVARLFPDILTDFKKIPWTTVFALMKYPHTWVRIAATRFQGALFAAVPVAAPDPDLPPDHPLSLASMVEQVKLLSNQLRSENLDAPFGLQIVKNLFYIGRCLYLHDSTQQADATFDAGADLEVDEADEEEAWGGVKDSDAEDASDNFAETSSVTKPGEGTPLGWMFSYLSRGAKIAMHERQVVREPKSNWTERPASIVRWFAAMVSQMEADTTKKYLPDMVEALLRVVSATKLRGDLQYGELKTLALELQQLLQEKVGGTKYSHVYNTAQHAAGLAKEERKEKETEKASEQGGH